MDKDALNMARALGFLEGKIDGVIAELRKETCPTAQRLADGLLEAWDRVDLIRNGNDRGENSHDLRMRPLSQHG